jgi:histidinol-phosphate aminotransferase
MVELVRAGKQVIVVKTFSKVYALAGLRIGYAFGHPDVLGKLAELRSVEDWWIGALGVRAALAALDDDAFVARSVN